MSVKKIYDGLQLKWRKMDDNQFCDSVQSELMSISEFMQEAQKRQKM